MNPIDDFAALRPDVEPPTTDELELVWERATSPDSARLAGSVSGGRRRLAVLGAAASLVLGVAAVAFVADRADAPGDPTDLMEEGVVESLDGVPEPSDVTVTPASTPEPTTTLVELVPGTVGPPPTWVVSDAEWIATELEPVVDPGLATVTLVAGPAGVAASWVGIVDGVSDPLVSVGGLATEPSSGSADPIIAWRTDPALGNSIVSAGGVAAADARSVFDAVRTGTALPEGFTVLPDDAGMLAQQRVTQRFDHPDGRWIEIDTRSGGQPRFDVELQRATAVEDVAPPEGVDASNIAYAGEYTLLLRTGFWVSTVRTSASSDAAIDFTAIADLVELGEPARNAPSEVTVSTTIEFVRVPRLAIGDSVMLGAATELAEDGLTVDAVESRAFVNGLDLVRTLAEQDRLPETMVVHLGSNGPITEPLIAELVGLVDGVETVILVTSAIDRDDNEANNALIVEYAATQENVHVLDWAELAAGCPGDCFEADGFHLTPDGRSYYAAAIGAALVDAGA